MSGNIIILAVGDDLDSLFQKICNILQQEEKNCVYVSNEVSNLSFQRLEIDIFHHKVYLDKKIIFLTHKQFEILLLLAKNPGRVYTYAQIYEVVWGEEYFHEKGNIMSQIRHIREKIEPDDSFPSYIENVRGVGYRFNNDLSDKR